MFKTTRGLVLREVQYKEADKLLTVLTESEGKLTLRARGALRRGGKLAAATQLLTFSEFTLFENKGRRTINEAAALEQFLGLRDTLSALALGTYFAELLEALSEEDCPEPAVLQLGLNSLYALSRGLCPQTQIKAVFELRLMCLTGYEPELSCCAQCGETEPERPRFFPRDGALCCGHCRPAGPASEHFALLPETLAAMRHIIGADPKKIFSFTLGEAGAKQLAAVCEAYLDAQLEHRFPSLQYWKKVKDV